MKKIKVLNFSALSYSGTTWLNLLIGSHDKVFTLGPPSRIWNLRKSKFDDACLVHGDSCPFWQGFDKFWDRKENFFIALSEFSGKTIFVMDNADPEFIDSTFHHRDLEILNGRYIRDARAITASYARKMSKTGISFTQSIQPEGWFYPSFQAIPSYDEMLRSKTFVVRYEDACKDQSEFLRKVGGLLGIEYSENAFKFWEWDHHITSGNQGPISMVKQHQNLCMSDFESSGMYQTQLNILKNNPQQAFVDERWKTQLTDSDLAEFDLLMGRKNEELGYSRSHLEHNLLPSFHNDQAKKNKSNRANISNLRIIINKIEIFLKRQ